MAGGLGDRITRLEGLVGTAPPEGDESLFERISIVLSIVENMQGTMVQELENLKQNNDDLSMEVMLLKRTVAQTATPPILGTNPLYSSAKVKVPEPKSFDGSRNARELENFIWDCEQYFKAAHIADADKVAITSMYLTGDAKLWWRTRTDADATLGFVGIQNWEEMKTELKAQFLPSNTSWIARDALQKLKQTGTVRDYVKEFTSLMLQVKNMTEEDKLFHFVSGLQMWAQLEIRRQNVQNLQTAIIAADALVDFRPTKAATTPNVKAKQKGKVLDKPTMNKKNSKQKTVSVKPSSSDKTRGKAPQGNSGCFLCSGPHRARDCPRREKLSALIAGSSSSNEGDATATTVNPLQLCGISEDSTTSSHSNLLYINAEINGNPVVAMLDTGATHVFVADRLVHRLGLQLSKAKNTVKTVNAQPQAVVGMSYNANVQVGQWRGRLNLMVIPLDDFDVVFGLSFFRTAKVSVLPHLSGIMVQHEQGPCFVACRQRNKTKDQAGEISAISLSNGLKTGEQTYLAAMVELRPQQFVEVPDAVAELLTEFEDIMPSKLPASLPPRRAIDHKIELLPGTSPPAKSPYRMSPKELLELRTQLTELLDTGYIQPSKAPYGAPVLFQKKKDGSMRMCVDYRALNKVTVRNRYPIPLIQDLMDRLSGAKWFSRLDLRSGYWQVRIAEGDEGKTTCVTRYGSYEFLVMPFGLTNAPATFCNLMNNVLHDFLDDFVVVYLDDIVIYSTSFKEHLKHLRQVFSRLREHQLFVKKEKCEFARGEIMFLGHIVGKGQVRMDPQKVKAIMEWSRPSKVPEMRSFLGLANYYRKFIKGYSKIAAPLTDLLKKDQSWCWTDQCQAAFDKIKTAISSEPVLRLPNFELPFEVHTDASDRSIGGVLVQDGHPVAFESRKLNGTEQRYSVHEKEMLAVIHCLQIWRVYLLGSKFTVKTDNVANTYFRTQKKLSPKQARWQEFLAEFDFLWEHKPGRYNQVADALSRKEVAAAIYSLSRVETDLRAEIREGAKTDAMYQRLLLQVQEGTVRRYWVEDGLLVAKGDRIFIPAVGGLRKKLMHETHDTVWAGHPGQERMLALLSRSYIWPRMADDIECYVRTCLVCQQDKIERRKEAGLLQPLPIPERPWISVSMDFITGFPKVDGCSTAFVVVDRFSKYAVFMAAPEPCPATTAAELFFRNVVKHFGLPADIVSDRDARFTGRFWTTLFNMVGSVLKFSTANHPQTDGQTERINALLEEYLRHFVTASQRNWVSLLDAAQLSYNLQRSSATEQSPFELVLGQQPLTPIEVARQSSGGKCPAAYRYARDKQELLEEAKDSLAKASKRMKKYADRGRRTLEFEVGDKVLLKLTPQIWKKISSKTVHRGLIPKYDGPFEVVAKIGNVAYRLKLPERLKIHPTFHVSFLRSYHADETDPERNRLKRAPPNIQKQFDKEVERILDHRIKGQSPKNRRVEFLIQWKGSSEEDATWERDTTLWQFEEQVAEFLRNHPTRASDSSGGGVLSYPCP